ncbi:MAG: NADH-quinone oxidoreductase subunit L [Hyphomicrobiaceae bacterium]
MRALLPLLTVAAPAVLVTAAMMVTTSSSARRFTGLAVSASLAALFLALAVALLVVMAGAVTSPMLGAAGIGASVRVDALSSIMLVLVAFIGVIVVRYARNYLDGDPGHVRFTRWLLFTLAAVLVLIVSGNLALLILAWVATSLALNNLLLFYPERPAARRAAAKKFWISRVGDACLVAAAALLYARFGTLDIAVLNEAASVAASSGEMSALVMFAALLIVATAVLKSAQLPLHGWLLEVMETPTPVSALLHAGIINAGGYLVLRLADVMLLATPALELLALIGGATALFGSLVMLTQTSVKVQLAYSTVAQMGFMLLQCGLGAFSSALLHIVAHSLYKAHAFLSSGSVMDLARSSWSPSPGGQPHPARLLIGLGIVVAATLLIGALFGPSPTVNPGSLALGAVLLMALVHLMSGAIDERPDTYVLVRTALGATAVAAAYFGLQAGMAYVTAGSLPSGGAIVGSPEIAIATLVIVSFAVLTVFQNQMARRAAEPFWQAAYVHLRHGLYLNTLANRFLLRLEPASRRPAASAQRVTH